LDLGLLKTQGKTPAATLSALMNTEISKRGDKSVFVKFGAGRFSIRTKFVEHIKRCVITQEDADLGMTLLPASALPYIPADREGIWLEVKSSNLRDAGMGLFAKRKITGGTVFAEYRGRLVDLDGAAGDHELYPYGISVQMADGSTKMIDGIDDNGLVLSFAPRANDAGPKYQNADLIEYKEHPGRVFLEAKKDIQISEEIFVIYGIHYWGFPQYPEYPTIEQCGDIPIYAKEWRIDNKENDSRKTTAVKGLSNTGRRQIRMKNLKGNRKSCKKSNRKDEEINQAMDTEIDDI